MSNAVIFQSMFYFHLYFLPHTCMMREDFAPLYTNVIFLSAFWHAKLGKKLS